MQHLIDIMDLSLAEKDELIVEKDVRMVVDSLDKNRIEKVHIYLPEDFYNDEEAEEDDD